MRRNRVILHGRAEFVTDLFVDGPDDFLAGEHGKSFRWLIHLAQEAAPIKSKNPALVSKRGAFVLATSYSRTTYRRTTIGAAAFHFRVRNGNGWCHCAIITRRVQRVFRRTLLVNV